jgi:hypothetical protein
MEGIKPDTIVFQMLFCPGRASWKGSFPAKVINDEANQNQKNQGYAKENFGSLHYTKSLLFFGINKTKALIFLALSGRNDDNFTA